MVVLSKICCLSVFLVIITGCNKYYEWKIDKPNPTSYCFDTNVKQIQKMILEGLGDYKYNNLVLYFKNDSTAISNIENIFEVVENSNDAYLLNIEYMKSKTYYKRDEPLLYIANFHIHLDSLEENKTCVKIITINPRIITGSMPGIGDNFQLGAANFKSVPPSTIEEYEILLIIGNQLGQKGMPPCNYPNINTKKETRNNSIF